MSDQLVAVGYNGEHVPLPAPEPSPLAALAEQFMEGIAAIFGD